MFDKQKKWIKEHEKEIQKAKKVVIGTAVGAGVVTLAVLKVMAGCKDESDHEIQDDSSRTTDLPIPDGWKYVDERWIDPSSGNQMMIARDVPASDFVSFAEQIQKVYGEDAAFVVEGK